MSYMTNLFNGQSHRLSRSLDGPHCGGEVGRVEIDHFLFGDLFDLRAFDAADLFTISFARTFGDTRSLSQKVGRRRRFRFKRERAIRINSDYDRDLHVRIVVLRFSVERLAKLHDVNAVLTQRGADRRRRVGLTGRDLQLNVAFYLLCHNCFRLTIPMFYIGNVLIYSSSANVTFSTSKNVSSYGVERPKIVIETLSVDLSSLTSSTLPVKLANGPDLILTTSPTV